MSRRSAAPAPSSPATWSAASSAAFGPPPALAHLIDQRVADDAEQPHVHPRARLVAVAIAQRPFHRNLHQIVSIGRTARERAQSAARGAEGPSIPSRTTSCLSCRWRERWHGPIYSGGMVE